MKLLKYMNIALLSIAAIVAILFYADVVGPDVLLYFAYILAGLAILGVFGFFIFGLAQKPQQIKYVLIGVVAVAILTLICYALSTPDAIGLDPELERKTSEGAMRWSEASLIGMYILFACAVVSIIWGSIRSMLLK